MFENDLIFKVFKPYNTCECQHVSGMRFQLQETFAVSSGKTFRRNDIICRSSIWATGHFGLAVFDSVGEGRLPAERHHRPRFHAAVSKGITSRRKEIAAGVEVGLMVKDVYYPASCVISTAVGIWILQYLRMSSLLSYKIIFTSVPGNLFPRALQAKRFAIVEQHDLPLFSDLPFHLDNGARVFHRVLESILKKLSGNSHASEDGVVSCQPGFKLSAMLHDIKANLPEPAMALTAIKLIFSVPHSV